MPHRRPREPAAPVTATSNIVDAPSPRVKLLSRLDLRVFRGLTLTPSALDNDRMPEEPLRTLIEGIHARLHEELDVQLRAMADSHGREVELARQAAHDEAERRWTSQLEAARLEWNTRMHAEVSNVRSESERAPIAETMRARVQAEQAAAESTSIARRELEESFAAERRRLEEQLEAERKRVTDASAERDRLAEALDAARRRTADAEAERQRLSAAVEAEGVKARTDLEVERRHAQADFDGEREQLRAALEAAREKLRKEIDVERERLAADVETHRLRVVELEASHAQQAAEIAAGRQQASELKLEIDRIAGDLELARLPREAVAAEVPGTATEAEASPDATVSHVSRLSEALGALDAAPDLTTLLAATVRAAAAEAPRAALFVVEGSELREWPVEGVASMDPGRLRLDGREAGVMAEALRRREPVATNGSDGPPAPFFATLPHDARALAVPLTLDGTPVAVLYADQGASSSAAASWTDAVRIVGRHAAVCAATLTAIRTAQAMRHLSAGRPDSPPPGDHPESRSSPLPGFVAGPALS